ncbi:sensor histidine kinase [Kocuria palustris]|uniref:sensor histidine kinase n=1 Tax=Kocuria palustris TaxID=71999 RepID=UPI0024311179|nr:histidine kinase [Kocuria palustris]
MSATTSQTAAPWAASAPEPPRQPWSPRRLQRPWFTAILTLLAFLLGPVVWGLILVVVLTQGDPLDPLDVYGPGRPVVLLSVLDVVLGLIAVALVPVALRHGFTDAQALEDGSVDPAELVDRPEPRSALIAALIIGVCVSLSVSAWLASLFTMISISSRGRRSWAGLVYVVTVAATIVGYFIQDSAEGWFEGLLVCGVSAVMLLVPVLIGMYRWSRRRRIRALQAEALTARREAAALVREEHARAEQSRAQERTRIAREMHDTLSHRLALISTYAGALDYREDLDRDTVRSTARLVQQTAATASAELRTVLDILRDDPGDTRPEPDLRQLPELLAEFRAAGARVEMVGREVVDAEAVPDTAARTLYRILQEALTNAVKHAPGAPVTVRWSRRAGAVSLTVSNPLVADAHPEPSGFGLVGLDERARGLGGTISTERTETMFRLEACIPCRS